MDLYVDASFSHFSICVSVYICKEYQNRAGYGITQGFFMNLVTGGIAFIVLFTIKGFSLYFTPMNVIFAFLIGLGTVIVKSMLVKAVSMGMVAISTIFYVSGGVLIPFIYGIVFLGEKLTVFKAIGIMLVCLSFLPIIKGELGKLEDKKISLKFIIYITQ